MQYEYTNNTLHLHCANDASITRREIFDDGSAFVLSNVLSQAECESLIRQAEKLGMESCGYSSSIRVTDRVAANSEAVAGVLFDRIKPFLEPSIDLSDKVWSSLSYPRGIPGSIPNRKWTPIGLNPVFRLCRYKPGGFFLPHHDGGFEQHPYNNRSLKTFMIYLNDDFEGGPTNFYNESQRHYQQGDPSKIVYSYQPKAGDALVFNSSITHDGGELLNGQKYIMRSEVMYSSVTNDTEVEARDDEKPRFPPDHDDDVDFGWD